LSTTGAFDLPSVTLGEDAFHADGDGLYDINLMFTSGGSTSHTFTQGEIVQYTVSAPGLTALSFDTLSTSAGNGSSGPFVFAAHIQNTGSKGNGSGWVTGDVFHTPEPASLVTCMIGAAACFLFAWRRRIRRA